MSVTIMDGIYSPSNLLPQFVDTNEGEAYVFLATRTKIEQNQRYDLYIHASGGIDWLILNDWGGVPGQDGKDASNEIGDIQFAGYNKENGMLLLCDGRSLKSVEYQELFNIIGIVHGGALSVIQENQIPLSEGLSKIIYVDNIGYYYIFGTSTTAYGTRDFIDVEQLTLTQNIVPESTNWSSRYQAFFSTFSQQIYKSIDGITWELFWDSPTTFNGALDLYCIDDNTGLVYAGTTDFLISTDGVIETVLSTSWVSARVLLYENKFYTLTYSGLFDGITPNSGYGDKLYSTGLSSNSGWGGGFLTKNPSNGNPVLVWASTSGRVVEFEKDFSTVLSSISFSNGVRYRGQGVSYWDNEGRLLFGTNGIVRVNFETNFMENITTSMPNFVLKDSKIFALSSNSVTIYTDLDNYNFNIPKIDIKFAHIKVR